MIQDTVRRLAAGAPGLEVLPPLLIGNRRHDSLLLGQMQAIGVEPAGIVLEPFGRNSAAAAATAALMAQEVDPDALVLLMSADALITDPGAFTHTMAAAAPAARDRIVLFGVQPTGPETGFGYIQAGDDLGHNVRSVVRFAEKPDLATAKAYVEDGSYLWNAGIFMFSPALFLAELERHAPDVAAASRAAFDAAPRRGRIVDLQDDTFAKVPSISVDYAVMERTDRLAVTPLGVEWADIGSWSELWRMGPRCPDNNFTRGDPVLIDVRNSLIWAEGVTIGAVGVDDLVIVATPEAVVVLPKSRAQDVKLVVEQIKAMSR